MIAIDTNLLIYAHRSGLPEHEAAKRAIERAARDPGGWGIALPSVAEFWSVVTHPASAGGPSTARRATSFLESLVAAGASVWTGRDPFWERLLFRAGQLGVHGARIFDLQIGLIALDNGAREIWTHDRRFVPLPGLDVRDPLSKGSAKP